MIEQAIPDFIKSREDLRTSQFILQSYQPQFGDVILPIAEGAREVGQDLLEDAEPGDIPSGMVWNQNVLPTGELSGGVLFNRDEFDESTVAGWAEDLKRILTGAVAEPDRDWRTL